MKEKTLRWSFLVGKVTFMKSNVRVDSVMDFTVNMYTQIMSLVIGKIKSKLYDC